jgi:hypothetical protein
MQNKEQKEDIISLFSDCNGKPYKDAGKIDYVSGWYYKASQYIQGTEIKVAFVSTNSITQGTMASAVWKPLYKEFGIHILFAWRTFIWSSESLSKAAVHCVIIGFTANANNSICYLFDKDGVKKSVSKINQYLIEGDEIFIEPRNTAICNVPKMSSGGKPVEGGNLIFESSEKEKFTNLEPSSKKYFKKFVGSQDYIHNKTRWCLWLINATPKEINSMPEVRKRIEAVREFRLNSKKAATRKAAEYPSRFAEVKDTSSHFVVVPEVSSERRRYIPIGYLDDSYILSNGLRYIPHAGLYELGVLTSNVHMAWTRTVCGRLKSDYDYSVNIVYNNFPWPSPSPEQKAKIEQTAQGILDARALYPDSSLADLYDPLTMPPELRKAHNQNNVAVMKAYGFPTSMSEADCVAALMKMYQELTEKSN